AHVPDAPVPAALSGLSRLAGNLWWTWDSEAQALFEDLSPRAWRAARRSPVRMLRAVSAGGLPAAAHDPAYVRRIEGVVARFDAYVSRPRGKGPGLVAYFSAEFGIHESLPIYSGGLGILAGDHLKSASDLGLPLVGVGLLYRQGYFTQRLTNDGWQLEEYPSLEFHEMPIEEVHDSGGQQVTIDLVVGERSVKAAAWKAQVGRVPLYFLDTDL